MDDENRLDFGPITLQQLSDAYFDALFEIVDSLVCICYYPASIDVERWRARAIELCQWIADIEITPAEDDIFKYRHQSLYKAVDEVLDSDYGALQNHFKSTYAELVHKHPGFPPRLSPEECYEKYHRALSYMMNCLIDAISFRDSEYINRIINSL